MKRLLALLLLSSCVKTEIVNAPTTQSVDTTFYKPKKKVEIPIDSIEERIPITFSPTVEEWEEI